MSGAGSPLRLTLAVNDSDQVRDLVTGRVPVDGAELSCLLLPVEEIFFRFTKFREWEVSEMSLGKYCALRARGDDSLVGIPVFLSRSFRHSGIFIREDGPVDDPSALAGGRIGIPEWTVTATVYQRALLQHEYGIDLAGVDWVQGGINEPGRVETLPVGLPAGVRVRPERVRSLNQMLLDGDLDAICVPHPPSAFEDRSGRIVQLFSDSRSVEEDYYNRTGIFPIMHLVVLRADVHERHPWAAMSLLKAFTEAKERSLARLLDPTAPHFPLPWGPEHARAAERVFGRDSWPYGIEPNRTTIEAFLRYSHEQGLAPRLLAPEDLFPPQVRESFLV
ncbi:ABC transporter substrate-binding protein [Streptomyces sp. NBC_01622]|uniref:ABC transporter substrate-binding protein n=1 Tax=Streptomyces sp. NBC_01622 TaxID=2975903 RepID=UPI003863FB28|nr:ABC transporter substrate-binding protein [Streptomyces sp. NBC_01622]